MDRTKYLARIGVDERELKADAGSLRPLQRQHLLSVPFENLDIHWQRPIVIDTARFYDKIVEEKRGGFCYELNGLFNELLRDLGFETRIVSARVAGPDGSFSPEYDHAAIIVTIDDEEFLADVGFGAFTTEPLKFIADIEQEDPSSVYIIRKRDDNYFEVVKRNDDGWQSEYMFKSDAHPLSDFAERCDFQQYSPDSHFKKGKLCSILTANGRKTLTDKSFIVTTDGEKNEIAVESEKQFDDLLTREFGIARN